MPQRSRPADVQLRRVTLTERLRWHHVAHLLYGRDPIRAEDAQAVFGRRSPKLARLEAALFAADGPLNTRRLAQVASLADGTEARTLVRRLNELYDAGGTAFRVEHIAGGYQLFTRPEFDRWLSRRHRRPSDLQLSGPALETLTIVAYRQPVLRADVEAIRGVQCDEMLRQLLDKGLVRIAGRDRSLGRPILYGTTRKFLQAFGLRSLEDLPMAEQLRAACNGSEQTQPHCTQPPAEMVDQLDEPPTEAG
jgi:segregation and condensation protein B